MHSPPAPPRNIPERKETDRRERYRKRYQVIYKDKSINISDANTVPSICQTIYEYASSTLATTTTYCADPLKFSVLVLIGIGLFLSAAVGGFVLAYKYRSVKTNPK
jgi:hypothetical protein